MKPSSDEDPGFSAYKDAWRQISYRVMAGRAWSGGERHRFFLNTGGGAFVDASGASGMDLPEDGRGLALSDWDGDGDLDLWITSRTAPRLRLLRNTTNPKHAVTIRMAGTRSNKDGVGARVTLKLQGGRPLTGSVRAGEGFISQGSKTLVLAPDAPIEQVYVRWPGGKAEVFTGVKRGGRYVLTEGRGAAIPMPGTPRKLRDLPVDPSFSPPNVGSRAIFLAQPRPTPEIMYRDGRGQTVTVAATAGRLALMVLWSRWCPACLVELKELQARKGELDAAGIDVVLLNADRLRTTAGLADKAETSDAALAKVLTDAGVTCSGGVIDDRTMARLELQHRALLAWRNPLPLPTSFLVDDLRKLRATYRGRVTVQRLVADAKVAREGQAKWQQRAAAGPGRFFRQPPAPKYLEHADLFAQTGDPEASIPFVEAAMQQTPNDAKLLNRAAGLYAQVKRYPEAEHHFRMAIQADPKHAHARANLAKLLRFKGDPNEAVLHAQHAVKELPDNPVLRHLLALCLKDAGRLHEAREQLGHASRLDPRAPVQEALAEIDRALGQR